MAVGRGAMPAMDGGAATGALHAAERVEGSEHPVIALTADAVARQRVEYIAAGRMNRVAKPMNPRLLETMESSITQVRAMNAYISHWILNLRPCHSSMY